MTNKSYNKKPIKAQNKKEVSFKKVALLFSITFAAVLIVLLILNIERIPYFFGKKDPVAYVGKEPIHMKQFKTNYIEFLAQYSQFTGTPQDASSYKTSLGDLLDGMIDSKAQVMEAKLEGVTLSKQESEGLNKNYKSELEVYKQNALYLENLKKIDLNEVDFASEVKNIDEDNLIINKLQKKVFNNYKQTIPKDDLVSIKARGIIMQLNSSAHSDEEIQKTIKEAYAMLNSGASFDNVISKYKDYIVGDQKSKNLGDMGWINKNDVPKDFWDKLNAIKPGNYTGIIQNKTAMSIIYIQDKKTINLDKLTDSQYNSLSSTDKFKAYYQDRAKKWREKFGVRKYITSFDIN